MNNLPKSIARYDYWFVFVVLEVAGIVLLVGHNTGTPNALLSTVNVAVGLVYEAEGSVRQYLHLREANESLLERNTELVQKVAGLEAALRRVEGEAADTLGIAWSGHQAALVLNNTTGHNNNYITIDRGERHGVRTDMGVVGSHGVVGIVCRTSAHYALVLPLLHTKSNLSCKIAGSHYFGYLNWDGGDVRYAHLKDLPRYAEFNVGDTVVTSGHSTIFPEGIAVGVVDEVNDSHDGISYLLKVRLATDFGRLSQVRVLNPRAGWEEQRELENNVER